MNQTSFSSLLSGPALLRWFCHQRTTGVRPIELLGEHPIEVVDEVQQLTPQVGYRSERPAPDHLPHDHSEDRLDPGFTHHNKKAWRSRQVRLASSVQLGGRESIAFWSIDRQDSHTVSSFRDVCAMTVLSDTTSSSRLNDPASILEHFAELPDPRREQGRIHELDEIVFLSFCAVLCGAHSWPQIADYATSKR